LFNKTATRANQQTQIEMGACLSAKFKKKNKVSPLLGSTTEFDDELIQRAKRYLKDQYQSSLQPSSTQTGPSLTNLPAMTNTLNSGLEWTGLLLE
jgi:hypothetical protein